MLFCLFCIFLLIGHPSMPRMVWNSTFFAFTSIIEGTTEKALQFIMPLKSIYNRNFGFIEQKMYFWTLQRVPSKKNCINWHYFSHEKKITVHLFRAAPYMFILVLHPDVLFLLLSSLWKKLLCMLIKKSSW